MTMDTRTLRMAWLPRKSEIVSWPSRTPIRMAVLLLPCIISDSTSTLALCEAEIGGRDSRPIGGGRLVVALPGPWLIATKNLRWNINAAGEHQLEGTDHHLALARFGNE